MSVLARAHDRLSHIERTGGIIACVAQFVIMAIVVADVVGRYALNMPIEWVYDLISRYLMALMFFFSLSWTLKHGEHVRVLYFRQFISARARRVLDATAALLAAAVFAMVLEAGITRFWGDWVSGDVFVGAALWPNWIGSMLVPIGVGIMMLRFAMLAAVNTLAAMGGEVLPGAEDDQLF